MAHTDPQYVRYTADMTEGTTGVPNDLDSGDAFFVVPENTVIEEVGLVFRVAESANATLCVVTVQKGDSISGAGSTFNNPVTVCTLTVPASQAAPSRVIFKAVGGSAPTFANQPPNRVFAGQPLRFNVTTGGGGATGKFRGFFVLRPDGYQQSGGTGVQNPPASPGTAALVPTTSVTA